MLKNITRTIAVVAALALTSAAAIAQEFDDGQIATTRSELAGKRVGFIPLSMGIDLGQVWYDVLKRDADRYGYELIVRDANWNVQAGAQAINEMIGMNVDVLVLHPADNQAYVRLVDKASAAGVPVVQVNMKSPNTGDAYVGANWYAQAQLMGQAMYDLCAPANGGTGKIAIITGNMTTPAAFITNKGLEDFFKNNPGLEVVANLPADYDSTKALAVATTILKQTPDLCGFIGHWEVMDMGTAAAVKEAGLQGKVHIVTSGGGEQKSTCDNVINGNFDVVINYDAATTGRNLSTVVLQMLQDKPAEPGKHPFGIYTPGRVVNKANADKGACWSLENVLANGL